MFTVNRKPSHKELRKFGRTMAIGFFVIGVVLFLLIAPRPGRSSLPVVLFSLGLLLWVLSMWAPRVATPVYVTWMTVGFAIGTVMSTILLTALFVFLLPLFSLIVRLGDPLRRRLGGITYWEDYKHYEPTLDRMRRPF